MHEADARLDHLSLRDLRLLGLLLETRSVTRTAEIVGLSQPAASRIVAKLRRVLDDPLVVRGGGGGALTPRGASLVRDVAAAAAAVERAFAPVRFDPDSATGTLRLATTDYGAAFVAAPFAARLAHAAPGIGLDVLAYASDTFEALARGTLDMALYADAAMPPEFRAVDLFAETYALVMRTGHPVLPVLDGGPTREWLRRCSAYPRVVMLYPDHHRMLSDDVLADLAEGGVGPARFATPYFLSAGPAIAGSDMILCLPSRAAHQLARAHPIVPVPLGADRGFTYRLVWHERMQRDPRQRWLRSAIERVASSAAT